MLLPRGRRDVLRQVAAFVGAYLLYQLVRGLVNADHAPQRAARNATRIIELERSLHVFVEPRIQQWALGFHWLMEIATWFYINANYAVTGGALLWIYLRRNGSFSCVRNTFMLAMAFALVGYLLYPTAPPRLMPQWGFTDVVRIVSGVDAERGAPAVFLNLDAAVPSMHVCFALMIAAAMIRLTSRRLTRVLWALYVPAVVFVVITTGNHYIADCVLGALTAAVSAAIARGPLARVRPDARTFERQAAGRPVEAASSVRRARADRPVEASSSVRRARADRPVEAVSSVHRARADRPVEVASFPAPRTD